MQRVCFQDGTVASSSKFFFSDSFQAFKIHCIWRTGVDKPRYLVHIEILIQRQSADKIQNKVNDGAHIK